MAVQAFTKRWKDVRDISQGDNEEEGLGISRAQLIPKKVASVLPCNTWRWRETRREGAHTRRKIMANATINFFLSRFN